MVPAGRCAGAREVGGGLMSGVTRRSPVPKQCFRSSKTVRGVIQASAPALASRSNVAGPHYRVPGNCSGTNRNRRSRIMSRQGPQRQFVRVPRGPTSPSIAPSNKSHFQGCSFEGASNDLSMVRGLSSSLRDASPSAHLLFVPPLALSRSRSVNVR